ncbi:hypothetical protein CEUSTIGMA_g46.t1 [Chlamydomonas eustigma]|uniref:H15 domain-containing protein n=1 Tax=Chlamydomonas eustigma TaxID=1157962 RepID=A0A250WPX2_9CHLO|nr:hypothetical protein CEUSTIGMA_g46.t1 [Chlamydomonas eustigma]|eukprot:GAX72590.1 hypothetical protein CEUSTIGMA_g46.t1 [Chlamydomonas eustigma]
MSTAAPTTAPIVAKKPKAVKPKSDKPSVSYVDLVKEAIVTLKERSGSSVAAIKKAIEAKGVAKALGAGWEKRLFLSIKAMVKSGKLVKVKASFKLGDKLKKVKKVAVKKVKAVKPKGVKKVAKASKPKTEGEKKAVKPKAAKKPAAAKPKTEKKEKTAKPVGVKKVKATKPKAPKAVKPKTVKAKKPKAPKPAPAPKA